VTTSDVFAARGEKFMQFKAVKTTKYFETSNCLSVCPSVCLPVRHTPVFCQKS